jgi:C1A family cysteine protease
MKLPFVAAAVTLTTTHVLACTGEDFRAHIQQYNLEISDSESLFRFDVFCDNKAFVEAHNESSSYTLALNQFATLTHEEFMNTYTTMFAAPALRRMRVPSSAFMTNSLRGVSVPDGAPATVDWVAKGAVTPVKDQGQCGSCWSFSTTGSMEGAYFVKYGTLVPFSEQELVDCSSPLNHGCNGGLPDRAFRWIQNNGGLCSEDSYPYVSGTTLKAGACQSCAPIKGSQVSGWTDLSPTNSAMTSALAMQPVSIAIEADQRAFQFYSGGVFPASSCGNNLDHAVLAVGYDDKSYKVKNSWGTSWGDEGYIYLEKSAAAEAVGGTCGMLLEASTVQLA